MLRPFIVKVYVLDYFPLTSSVNNYNQAKENKIHFDIKSYYTKHAKYA